MGPFEKVYKKPSSIKESLKELLYIHPIPDDQLMTSSWIKKLTEKILQLEEKKKRCYHTLSEDDKQLLNRYSFHCKSHGKTKNVQYLMEKPTNTARFKDCSILLTFEESMELIKSAHIKTSHGGPKLIEKTIREDIEKKKMLRKRFSRFSVPLFFILEACLKCKNKYEIGIPEYNILPKSKSVRNQTCHATVSVDILDMLPDNVFKHLLIVQYKETNYIQLRPLTSTEDSEIFSVLYQLFMDLIVPKFVIVTPEKYKFYLNIMEKLGAVANTTILVKTDASIVELKPSIMTRMAMWLKREVGGSWGIGCNFVQWEMNNIQDMYGNIPYSKMFSTKAFKSTRKIDIPELIGKSPIMNKVNLQSQNQTNDRLENTNILPFGTRDSNNLHIKQKNNVIKNTEIGHEYGATLHIPDDNSLIGDEDDFEFQNFTIKDEKCIQNYEDPENDVLDTNIITREDNETIIPDIKPENIPTDSVEFSEIKIENISYDMEDNIEETKHNIQTTNSLATAAAATSDVSVHICVECKKVIKTKVYICNKCTGNMHLYCGSQLRDEKTSAVVSICVSCKIIYEI